MYKSNCPPLERLVELSRGHPLPSGEVTALHSHLRECFHCDTKLSELRQAAAVEEFDPYHEWLGIPPGEQPPNHYRLLGLTLFENNPRVIDNGADRELAHIRKFQAGKHADAAGRILNEISRARICLLNLDQKSAYDRELRANQPGTTAEDVREIPTWPIGQLPATVPEVLTGIAANEANTVSQSEPVVVNFEPSMVHAPRLPIPVTPKPSATKVVSESPEVVLPARNRWSALVARARVLLPIRTTLIACKENFTTLFNWKTVEIVRRKIRSVSPGLRHKLLGFGITGFVFAILGMICASVGPFPPQESGLVLYFRMAEMNEELEEPHEEIVQLDVQVTEVSNNNIDSPINNMAIESILGEFASHLAASFNVTMYPDDPNRPQFIDFDETQAPKRAMGVPVPQYTGIAHRTERRRFQLERLGGNANTEAGVVGGLDWLAAHQLADGGWSFNHGESLQCKGNCGNAGSVGECRTGATGLALLAFLGAGETHKSGKYRNRVEVGLNFLISQLKVDTSARHGVLSQPGGTMYAHGIATMALCEAYAMTRDRSLLQPAQLAVNYIVFAQDPVGGGWRYQSKQPGDTSISGWQLMTFKVAHNGYLTIPSNAITRAVTFLNSVQSDNGARYGYTDPGAGPATTASGLLCRIHLGWKKDHPAIERGVEFLSSTGPSLSNAYFNYHSNQVLRHYGGEKWSRWNSQLSAQLLRSQDQVGHQRGSWYFSNDEYGKFGGRLFHTALSTMMLEVYYRQEEVFRVVNEEAFPLGTLPSN